MTDVPEAVGRRILPLLAVERGLQDEGQGNAARLFRAAALGEALRATRFHQRLGRGLEQAMTDIIVELRAAGSHELAALMAQALATVSAGGWPTLAQVPPTFVCRGCGEVCWGIRHPVVRFVGPERSLSMKSARSTGSSWRSTTCCPSWPQR
jgi:hypothetical protein